MTVRSLLKLLEEDGWALDRVNGSHHVFKHPTKHGSVVVAIHALGDDVRVGTLKSIMKKAKLR